HRDPEDRDREQDLEQREAAGGPTRPRAHRSEPFHVVPPGERSRPHMDRPRARLHRTPSGPIRGSSRPGNFDGARAAEKEPPRTLSGSGVAGSLRFRKDSRTTRRSAALVLAARPRVLEGRPVAEGGRLLGEGSGSQDELDPQLELAELDVVARVELL